MQENTEKTQNIRSKKKLRIPIPEELASEIEFLSDMTCCVCHIKGRPIQIHHIDEDPANNKRENLAILCLDCHDRTQIKGGFGRKLSAKVIIRYRDHWLVQVSKKREQYLSKQEATEITLSDTPINNETDSQPAEQYLNDLKRKETLENYQQAIRLDPNNTKNYIAIGRVLSNLKRYEEALDAYEQAIRLDPNNATIYIAMCKIFNNINRYEEALDAYEQAIRLDPNNIAIYNKKGNTLHRLKRYEEAALTYKQAVDLDSTCTMIGSDKKNAQIDLHKVERELRYNSNDNDKNDGRYNSKGYALLELGRYEEALQAFERAIRLNPKKKVYYNNLGYALNKLGRHEEALQACEKALTIDPHFVHTYKNISMILNDLGKYEEALQNCEEALTISPKIAAIHIIKGIILYNLRKYEEVSENFFQLYKGLK